MTAGQGKPKFPRLINAALALLLAGIALLSIHLTSTLHARQRMAVDLAEVKDIKYGLLNADVWVQQATTILERRADEFRFTPERRRAIKPILERSLDTFITEADAYTREQNRAAGFTGRLKQGMQDAFVDINKVKAGIPRYADRILDELDKPQSRREIAGILKHMLREAKQTTFAEVDPRPLQGIKAQYQCPDRLECRKVIGERIRASDQEALWQLLTLLTATVMLFVAVWAAREHGSRLQLALLVLCSTVLMACGVLSPMMEVEARISELRFMLLSQPVVFTDQVMYYKSKSVLDVARTLMTSAEPQIKLVGVLVIVFGVILPLLKLAASFAYLYSPERLRRSRIVEFFALKSGKWSMADVFVVAIFMAYVGFDTLISKRLSRIAESGSDTVSIFTANGTTLQTGFFVFLAFCFASMLTSSLIASRSGR